MRHSILYFWRNPRDPRITNDLFIIFCPMPMMVRQTNDDDFNDVIQRIQHTRMKKLILPKIAKQKALLYIINHV